MPRSLSLEMSDISRHAYRRTPPDHATVMTRKRKSPPLDGNGNRIRYGASSPSPRLPSGRSRPSSTGYGEGRGEGASPRTQTDQRGPLTRNEREERAHSDLSPQAGRDEDRIAKVMARVGLCSRRDAEEWIA